MIKCQRRRLAQTMPTDFGSIIRGSGRKLDRIHDCQIGNTDGATTWVASRIAEGVQLFEPLHFHAGLLA